MSESPSPTTSPDTSSSALASDGTVPSHQDDASVSTFDGSSALAGDLLARRRSIQFNVAGSDAELSRRRAESLRKNWTRSSLNRIPSPPPPSAYNRGVSFDTFDNRDATDFSLTLNYKHKDYHASRRSRTFLCGTDQNDYSDFALEWLIDELVDDGDEIVCLRVVEKDSKIASDSSVEEGRYRQEAQKLLDQVIAKNSQDEKAISLVMELAVGKVQEIIQRMIQIYEPAVLIVGTRGRSLGGMQGLLPGSVSKYCLQQSPIPVIVVRPSTKREKKKKKRLANSKRNYNHLLRMSEMKSGRLFDKSGSAESSATKLPEEEAAVAEAVGMHPPNPYDPSLGRDPRLSFSKDTASTGGTDDERSDHGRSSSIPNSEDFSSVVLKSPGLENLESPAVTDGEEEDEDDDDDDDDDDGPPMIHSLTSGDHRRVRSTDDAASSGSKSPLVSITNVPIREATLNNHEIH
ncbi:hypothetical protein FQN53_008481 [Emmonsiellopsis sp. PD_33]|nr:hypothetical protein FQN53_008481 [Emmonsiellopsis sp. PD_33]